MINDVFESCFPGDGAPRPFDCPALDVPTNDPLIERYPQFFWNKVEKHIGQALRYLDMTMEGKQWTATLYSHIFAIEHNRRRTGPQAGATADHR